MHDITSRIRLVGPPVERDEEILTPQALAFVTALDAAFAERRCEILESRRERRAELRAGGTLDFLASTRAIREDPSWCVAPVGAGLADRRVEITGPPTPTMTVNALNSGANIWMADFEDATTPTWQNLIEGQVALLDALDRRLDFTTADGRRYRLNDEVATIVVRPRGWHLVDKHVLVDGRPISASLLDFGLHFFHGARRQLAVGAVPAFYLPKLESHLEARLWNDVFTFSQAELGIPHGTIRATVLIETIPAAFEMEEILYELRDHAAGLNAGRWDYVFSVIKNFGHDPRFILPDRSQVTMKTPFMRAYTELLVSTCHRRGAHAIGGMAAAVPIKSNPELFERALTAVRADKEREAGDGFDGSWVAHPALVATCSDVFTAALGERIDQKHRLREEVSVSSDELLDVQSAEGDITEAGVRGNLRTALRYLAAWLDGSGAVALDGLMEDAATVEIARCQLWQWRTQSVVLADGTVVCAAALEAWLHEELQHIVDDEGRTNSLERAADLLRQLMLDEEAAPFFTSIAYARWLSPSGSPADACDIAMSENVLLEAVAV